MANSMMGLRPASRLTEYDATLRMIEEQRRRKERELSEQRYIQHISVPDNPNIQWASNASVQVGGNWSMIMDLASGAGSAGGWTAIAALARGEDTFSGSPVALVDMPEMDSIGTVPIQVSEEDLTSDRNRLAMDAESVLGYTKIRQKIKAPSQLRCVVARLEIEVLNAAEVQGYKLQACKHMSSHKKLSDPRWAVTPLKDFKGEIPEFVIMKAVEVKKELPNAEFFVEHLQEDPFLLVSTLPLNGAHTGWTGTLGRLAVEQPDDVMYLEVWNEKSFEAGL